MLPTSFPNWIPKLPVAGAFLGHLIQSVDRNVGFKCGIQVGNPEHSVFIHQITAKTRKVIGSYGGRELTSAAKNTRPRKI